MHNIIEELAFYVIPALDAGIPVSEEIVGSSTAMTWEGQLLFIVLTATMSASEGRKTGREY